ncbi:unnamed protein product [Spirodela intermedia]|uniref:Uncharacterized protein n=1 Tax=Spirodela intermedia TaxID=51605 RepID=A0A7I8J311_SPIIN|nr:unnamed protein product [Spirodela intermedia]CAA6664193.1 unnamed protein product [Spirodela intermedia]
MSMSDSDSSSSGGTNTRPSARSAAKVRLLHEMLRSARVKDSKGAWKVLIMDKLTTKIMSYSCKMADITEEGVSLVEDLSKRRQPLPSMDAIYFIQPSKENVVMFLSDMSGRCPLYKKAFIFFSSPISKDLVAQIKSDTSVLPRIGALSEMNLEYFAIDSQGFITDHERALEELFGENVENSRKFDSCLNTMAVRIATVFASLKEFPNVRYHAPKSSKDAMTVTTFREVYKATLPTFPQQETCELLIVDRSIDQIAPVIHEWTYDAMCHDLLNMEGNKYVHEQNRGPPEKKEVLLEDHDPIWLELRHVHIADASERLHEKMTNFLSKNKAAQIHHGSRGGGELSTRDLQKMVQALPQYSEQVDKLSLHVDIAGKLNKLVRELGLRDVGQLEQDLVFGDAGTKEMINFLRANQEATRENKLRLLMIYASIYPEKFEGDKGLKLMQLARLSSDDMNAVNNMKFLGAQIARRQLKKHAARKERHDQEGTWQLARFYPMIEELIEKLSKGELPKDEYPCMNDPSPSFNGTSISSTRSTQPAHDSILKHASSDFKKMGQRIFVFIIGGATRSELRVVHKLTSKLKREVILGSSSLDDPPQFMTKLKLLSQDIMLDDLHL